MLLRSRAGHLLQAGGQDDLLRTDADRQIGVRVSVANERVSVDEVAWGEFRKRLRSFVARRVPDPSVHDDLVQDILLRLHRSLGELRDAERLDAFAYRVARNAIVDHFRVAGREQPVDPEDLEDHAAAPPADGEDDSAVGRAQLARCLRPIVERLDERYRQALLLTDLGDLSQAEAARRLGVSVPGMKSRVQRARSQLRAALSECCSVELDAARQIDTVQRVGPCACD